MNTFAVGFIAGVITTLVLAYLLHRAIYADY